NIFIKILTQYCFQIKIKCITKKSKANDDELNQNVRSRSAIFRVVEKL
ncbi:16S rRNA (cytosine(1402)-N(4))-methyltransferase, partial [Francisella tularensis subsp. holarctica]